MQKIMDFLHDNWVGIIFIMTLILFFAWLAGYIANGLYNCRFDLSSCWAGVGSIASAGVLGWGKWFVDSRENSPPGEMPNKMDRKKCD